MDDLKILDSYTRMYHFLQMAAGKQWMEDVPRCMEKRSIQPLELWIEGFKSGDKYSNEQQKQASSQTKQQKQNNHSQQQKHNSNQAKQQIAQPVQQNNQVAPNPKENAEPAKSMPVEQQSQKVSVEDKKEVAAEQTAKQPATDSADVANEKQNGNEPQPAKKRQYRRKPQRNKFAKAE